MAIMQVNFLSKTLFRTVPLQVILPVDKFVMPGTVVRDADRPFKTLYLLHGLLGNYTDWVTGTRIQGWAEEKNLAVVMPSGDNSFYVDRAAPWNNYGEFIGQELVEITRKMFPLSHDREDTFIAGLSMGGFGAIRNGLKYHETFGCIAALSSAIHILEDVGNSQNKNVAYEEGCFGNLKEAASSDKNPRVIVQTLKEKIKTGAKVRFPKIYMACGTDDSLIKSNRAYRDFFTENGLDLTYEEEPGHHDWDFWDKYINKVLEWLPLEDTSSGINSGNVTR
jgi:S-formylglutathione hydrolase FrmB